MVPVVARLVLARGGAGTYLLRPGVSKVGRTPECDVFLDDQTVSRFHATLVVDDRSTTVQDHKSRNGTFVGGKRIAVETLKHGTEVIFGGVHCIFEQLEGAFDDDSTHSGATGPNAAVSELSIAEKRVFDLLICGFAEKAIACELSLSRHTVHNHVKRIYRIFGVHTRSELLSVVLG
jgi:DNA-binding CsgD family transcriptional regulator